MNNTKLTEEEKGEKIYSQTKKYNKNNKTKRNMIKKDKLEEKIQEYRDTELKEKMYQNKPICMILDNYRPQKTVPVKNVANILNIELIYITPYSPELYNQEH